MFCRKFCFFKYLHKDFVIKILDAFNALMDFIGKLALVIKIHSFFQRTLTHLCQMRYNPFFQAFLINLL